MNTLFQKDNKVAEKWTEQEALEEIEKIYDLLVNNATYLHLGRLLIDSGNYPEMFIYFRKKFGEDGVVFQAIKTIEAILEARIVEGAMNGELKGQTMGIFYLKNKHGYKDTSVQVSEDEKGNQVPINEVTIRTISSSINDGGE